MIQPRNALRTLICSLVVILFASIAYSNESHCYSFKDPSDLTAWEFRKLGALSRERESSEQFVWRSPVYR